MKKKLLKTALCTFLLCQFSNMASCYSQEIEIAPKAPEFELNDLDGDKVSLKDFQGKVVALFFWATWCPYCQKEVPKLIKLNEEFKDRGFEILTIDYKEDVDKLKRFAQRRGINYKILIDKTGDVFDLYNIPGLPVVMILDKKGMVQYTGFSLPEDYKEILERLLASY